MKTIMYSQYGPPEVLQFADTSKPTPRNKEVLVKVYATTVTIGDTIMRSFILPIHGIQMILGKVFLGWRKPRRHVLGMELAGKIEAIGKKVTRFNVGDPIFASTVGINFGGYAEYKCIPENGVIAIKPVNLSFEEAAAIPGAGQTAWRCLEKTNIQPNQKVLIYGASGAVGTFAVQLASRYFRADVTGACSETNLEMVKSIGARHVIDYKTQDFTQGSERFDVIFDAVGKLSKKQAIKVLKNEGVYLNVHADSSGGEKVEYMLILKELVEAGMIKPVIDRIYTIEQIIEAHRYVDQGHKKGNVAITFGLESESLVIN